MQRRGDVVRRHPESPLAWAALAEEARDAGADDVTVYAYARVGYHRSLDLLRRNGWKGHGPVPWEHEPNRGFLRALALSPPPGRSARPPSESAAGRSSATPARRRTTCCSPASILGVTHRSVSFCRVRTPWKLTERSVTQMARARSGATTTAGAEPAPELAGVAGQMLG